MGGVFRDRDGQYRYQTINEYEERRRRDLDRPPPPPYRPSRISEIRPYMPVLAPAPAAWEPVMQVPAFTPLVTAWPGEPASGLVEAVATNDLLQMAADIRARDNNAFFDSLVSSPPPMRVGEFPLLDATFDAAAAAGAAVPYQPTSGQLLEPSGRSVWAQDLLG